VNVGGWSLKVKTLCGDLVAPVSMSLCGRVFTRCDLKCDGVVNVVDILLGVDAEYPTPKPS